MGGHSGLTCWVDDTLEGVHEKGKCPEEGDERYQAGIEELLSLQHIRQLQVHSRHQYSIK
jgi:hypothetical protein